jgi:hypothetical protein
MIHISTYSGTWNLLYTSAEANIPALFLRDPLATKQTPYTAPCPSWEDSQPELRMVMVIDDEDNFCNFLMCSCLCLGGSCVQLGGEYVVRVSKCGSLSRQDCLGKHWQVSALLCGGCVGGNQPLVSQRDYLLV